MIRATVIDAIRTYLSAAYSGSIAIHPETSVEEMEPPYAVVRIGSGEHMYPGVAEIWDLNILIGVFHDADTTTAAEAEAAAATLFALFDDPAGLYTSSAAALVWSAMERIATDAAIVETRWQHIAGFRTIVAPVADD